MTGATQGARITVQLALTSQITEYTNTAGPQSPGYGRNIDPKTATAAATIAQQVRSARTSRGIVLALLLADLMPNAA